MSSHDSTARIHELEAKVAELTTIVDRLAPATTSTEVVEAKTSSRRNMLRLAGAAAVGVAGAAVVGSGQAAAASGDNMIIGESNLPTVGDVTSLIGVFTSVAASNATGTFVTGYGGSIAGWDTSNDAGNIRGGVLGMGGNFLFPGVTTTHGVVGRMFNGQGTGGGVFGISESNTPGVSAGVRARSTNGPSVQLVPVATGAPAAGAWTVGALQPDTAGNLWYCIASGTPGTWRNLSAAPTVYPTFHPVSPGRVYDSRSAAPNQGIINNGNGKTISVAAKRDSNTGAVIAGQENFVPAGATSITCNVTVTDTAGAGYLTILPGGQAFDPATATAAVNWSASGQILNNGTTLTLNVATREVVIYAGGGGNTNVVIDVTGYFL